MRSQRTARTPSTIPRPPSPGPNNCTSLADDATVDAVLEPLANAIPPALLIADHTTTAPTPTRERVARWDARGRAFLHAPVFMGPQNAREGNGIMLASGDRARFERFEPTLATMTGKVLYLGEDPARAAAFKLFGNLTIIVMTAGLADVNRLAHALDIETADAFSLFDHFNPGTMFPVRAKKIAAGDFTPTFEMTMARKDVRLMIEEARRHGVELGVMPAIAAIYDEAIARGLGNLDTSAIARVDGAAATT